MHLLKVDSRWRAGGSRRDEGFAPRNGGVDSEGGEPDIGAGTADSVRSVRAQAAGLYSQGFVREEGGGLDGEFKRRISNEDRGAYLVPYIDACHPGSSHGVGIGSLYPRMVPDRWLTRGYKGGSEGGSGGGGSGRRVRRTGMAGNIFPQIQRRRTVLTAIQATAKEGGCRENCQLATAGWRLAEEA